MKSKEVSRKRQTCWAEGVIMSEYGLVQLYHKSVMICMLIIACNMPGTSCHKPHPDCLIKFLQSHFKVDG